MRTLIFFTINTVQLFIQIIITFRNLEMIDSIWYSLCQLYANVLPFYVRDLTIYRSWYL